MLKRIGLLFVLLGLVISLTAHPLFAQRPIKTQGESTQFAKTFKHYTANVNDLQLHYVMGGRGDAVVLLPGWPETWYAWRKVMPLLASRYQVIAVDPPGIGDSEIPKQGYDTRTVAANIKGIVDQLGLKQIFLVGHDVGTWIAYAYAAAYPDTVRRLVVLDAAIPGVTSAQAFQLSPQTTAKTFQFFFHAVPDLPEEITAGRERQYLTWFFQNKAVVPKAISEADLDEYVRQYSEPGAMRAGFEYYRVVPEDMTQNQTYAATKLTMPVLALGGDQKKATGNGMLQTMQTAVETVEGGELKGCGHYLAEECPDALTEQILSFLANSN